MEKDKIMKDLHHAKDSIDKYSSSFGKYTKKLAEQFYQNTMPHDLKKRVVSAVILIPCAIYAICFSESLFLLLAVLLAVLITLEWTQLTKSAKDKQKWQLIGILYITIPVFCVIKLRMIDSDILLWMFGIIWATDVFAFFAGKTFGGKKLAPTISPNKTWSGLVGGVIASILIGLLSSVMFNGSMLFFIFISAFLSLIEQAGDLLESKFKRIFEVKDSGNIIPGHGGILDRLDGMMSAAPATLLFVAIFATEFSS
ncbi:MAG: phosphatidate cytidylyltransferase [Rickettsiales bacterium]|nr:phosphatidate cytidylyltransferase [Rickettsiales bacterium]